MGRTILPGALLLAFFCYHPIAESDDLGDEVRAGLRKAVAFYSDRVASHGGYVYYYSEDLTQRWGEGSAAPSQIWVQPPGTPTVGMAYLRAYEATGERRYLDAATKAARALLYGQLESGCWTYAIDFDPDGKRSWQYRNGQGKGKNYSTLDDDVSQAALRFLMSVDRHHGFAVDDIHEGVRFGLDALLAAQYPSGGFPQGWSSRVQQHPILKAAYPEYDWRTENRIKEYWDLYTLNDGLAGNVARILVLAHDIYGDECFRVALARLGDFLLLAQMPEPQPAWCQQYTFEMKPAWARKFEPPAIASSESMDVMRTLMMIYAETRDEKYLRPIPPALAYLENSRLEDGRLPRYLELKSNRPLYMTRKGKSYELVYDDSRLPAHYAFKIDADLDTIRDAFRKIESAEERRASTGATGTLEKEVRRILNDLDDQGRWVSVYEGGRLPGQPKFRPGFRFVSSARFAENVEELCAYLTQKSTAPRGGEVHRDSP